MSEILDFVESFQTLIVGILGFLGVVATLSFNSKLSRDLRKDELHHERNSIRHALITELQSLKSSFEGRARPNETEQDLLILKKIETSIYDVLLPKIHVLSPKEIESVLQAYLLIRETPTRLSLLAAGSDMDGVPEDYFHIKNKYLDTALGMHGVFIKDIDKALDSLNNELGT